MPRGIPNAKRDDTGLRYTLFHVPLPPNPKQMGSSYLRKEDQTIWWRNVNLKKVEESAALTPEPRRGSHVIVIHPGSRFVRIGKASDMNPVSVPAVVARRFNSPVPPTVMVERICHPAEDNAGSQASHQFNSDDEYAVPLVSDDPFDVKLQGITVSLRDRMRFYKLHVTQNAASIASTFNSQFKPEIISEANDPYHVEWVQGSDKDVLVGEQALQLADPSLQNYCIRWPLYGNQFNSREYKSLPLILSDIEILIRSTLEEKYDINAKDYHNYSVILVMPDLYDRSYVREWCHLLLVIMGFKQLCAQQESLAATYGAGISNACVVNIGAVKTSVACVDEGLVIPDSRLTLNMGGDDITEFLYILLRRIGFPYNEINLTRSYDWNVMEDLKARLCTLAEGDVALNLYDFDVRQPNKPTEKYGLRAYDEIILAPMCLFEPRVIEFDKKLAGMHPTSHPDVSDDILEPTSDKVTQAMIISTQHLLPQEPAPALKIEPAPDTGSAATHVSTPADEIVPTHVSTPANEPAGTTRNGSASAGEIAAPAKEPVSSDSLGGAMNVELEQHDTAPPSRSRSTRASSPVAGGGEHMDVDGEGNTTTKASPPPTSNAPTTAATGAAGGGGEGPSDTPAFNIDVCFEASKLPLDVAILNSVRAVGTDEKIRKYLQAVLVVGGTALIPGMAHALESRLLAIANPIVPSMTDVQIIPPPKEVDPRVLVWKGAAVLGKMEGVSDLWLTVDDWNVLGMRGLKERCFYL